MECDHLIHVDATKEPSHLLDVIVSALPWVTTSSISTVIVLALNARYKRTNSIKQRK